MGYQEALIAAGCNVIEFKEFGSYQGTWLAFVEYKGEKGIVEGYYGSCSGCDAFLSQFDFSCDEVTQRNDGKYYRNWTEEVTEEEYNEYQKKYQEELAAFGQSYLVAGPTTLEYWQNRKQKLDNEIGWVDEDEKEFVDWAISKYLQNQAT